jgi:hypothetical protein
MPGTRPLQLGFELVAYNTVEGFIGHLEAILLAQPALDLEVTGKAGRGCQTCFELLEHERRERLLPCRRPGFFVGQEGVQAAVAVSLQPVGNRVSMHSEMGGCLVAARDLAGLEQH